MIRLAVLAVANPSNGGVFQYTLSILRALMQQPGLRITVYTASSNHHYDDIGLRMRYVRLTRFDLARLAAASLLGRRLAEPFGDDDLVLAPTYSPLLLHTRRPLAFTLHDLQERYLPHNFSRLQRAWRGFLQRRLCGEAARIVCESPFVQRDIVRFFGVDPGKVIVLPSPPALASEKPVTATAVADTVARLSLPERFLFYPAQFWPHKNHARLVEAFARLSDRFPDVQLLFTGGRNGEHERVFARVEALGLDERIRHLGYVDQGEMTVLYQRALALVMPSLFESVSIPVYEAQHAGTPVCASGVLAIADQVGDSGLTFDPLSVASIQDALERLLGDEALRNRLGAAGRARFQAMDWEQFGDRLREVVFSLATATPATAAAAGGLATGMRRAAPDRIPPEP